MTGTEIRQNRGFTRKWAKTGKPWFSGIAALLMLFGLSQSVIYLTAFEAHVVNVTATIERPPTQCDARSKGYWANNEGCSQGQGESIWADEVQTVSMEFSGYFYNVTGAGICSILWIPNCPSGNDPDAARCKARAHALADELNLAAGRLDFDAYIAGADDGSWAFDRLGLSPTSTMRQALEAVERILGNQNSSKNDLNDAGYVAMRIYTFYEKENKKAPQCITEPPEAKECYDDSYKKHKKDHDGKDDGGNDEKKTKKFGEGWESLGFDFGFDLDFTDEEAHGGGDEGDRTRGERGETKEHATSTDDTATSTPELEIPEFPETATSTAFTLEDVLNDWIDSILKKSSATATQPTATSSPSQISEENSGGQADDRSRPEREPRAR